MPASYGEVMQAIGAQAFFDANRNPNNDRVILPMPWDDKTERAPAVTPDELAELRAQLKARSAFAE